MTSLEVIKEVMNVPMEAVHAIARMNGISTADDHERNISEKQLRPFTEAFERKTRNYFVNSMRNYAHLTPQELQTFAEFCKTFKKGNVSLGRVSNWSHIGKTRLRQYFVDKIKEKTPSSPTRFTAIDLFSGCGGMDALIERVRHIDMEPVSCSIVDSMPLIDYYIEYGSEYATTDYRQRPSRDLLCQINSSWEYHASIKAEPCYNPDDVPDIVRQIVLSARYYVYIDDDDDHHMDTVIVNGHNDHIINSPLMMVA